MTSVMPSSLSAHSPSKEGKAGASRPPPPAAPRICSEAAPPHGGCISISAADGVWKRRQNSHKAAAQMPLEAVHKGDIMKRTAQMCKDNIVNVLLLLLFYHLSLIAGSLPAGVGSLERAFS